MQDELTLEIHDNLMYNVYPQKIFPLYNPFDMSLYKYPGNPIYSVLAYVDWMHSRNGYNCVNYYVGNPAGCHLYDPRLHRF